DIGGFKNLPDRCSRRREEAELDLLQKSASSRRRLRLLNPPFLVTFCDIFPTADSRSARKERGQPCPRVSENGADQHADKAVRAPSCIHLGRRLQAVELHLARCLRNDNYFPIL